MRASDRPIVDARWALPGQLADADPQIPENRRRSRTPRDWAVDVTTFLLASLTGLGFATIQHVSAESTVTAASTAPLGVVDPVLGLLLTLSLWWRRRFPVQLAIIGVLASTVSVSASGAMLVLLFSLAVHRPWPVSVPVALALVPAQLLLDTLRPELVQTSSVANALFSGLLVLAILAWGIAVRARRQLVLGLQAAADQERRQHQLLLHGARRAERESIAREMHDVLAHRISLLSVHAGALEYRTRQSESGTASALTATEVHEAVTVIRENAHQALEELREVLTVLRTETEEEEAESETGTAAPQVGVHDLAALVEEAQAAGQLVHLDVLATDIGSVRPQLQRTVYRVVQEGLTNARKHAPQAPVNVVVQGEPGRQIEVDITNVVPLSPFASEIPGAGAGLTGLGERVAIEGGTLDARTTAGAFRLKVRLPWRT